jgi:hypothetical protein
LIISVYIQGLVVMLNLGSRNVWINGRCCVLVNHDFTHDNQPLNVYGNNQYFTFYINRTSVALFTKIRNYSPNFFT